MVFRVRHINVATAIHRYAYGSVETCCTAGAVGAAIASCKSSERCHHPGGSDLADRSVELIRHVDVATAIYRHASGIVKTRCFACAVGAACVASEASERCHYPGGSDLADRMVEFVRHIDVATAVHCNASRIGKTCCTASAVGAALAECEARERCHHPGRGNRSDQLILTVRHIDIATAIHRYTSGMGKSRRAASAVSAAFAAC